MISLAIGGTVALLVVLGLLSSKRVRGENRNFAVAGRTLTVPLVAVLLMSQVIDSNATVGAADLAGGFGFWAGAAMPLGIAVSFLLMGLFVAEKVRERELYSLPGYFRQTFGRTGEILSAVLTVSSFGILMAGNLVALGHMMDHFVGVPYWAAIVFVTVAILAYTMVGGMFASVYTGLFLMVVMGVGFVGLTLWMFLGPGYTAAEGLGISDLEQLTAPAAGAAINWATLFALGFGNLVAIDVFQRVSSARSARGARAASLIAAVGTVVLCVPLAAVAVAGAGLLGDSGSESPILFQLLTGPVPTPIAMLVISALLAASLTTVSGILLATSSIVVGTILDTRNLRLSVLQASRWAMVPVAAIGIVVALRVNHTGILLTLTFDLLCASLVVPFLLSLWTRLVSTRALIISAALGLGVRLGFFVFTPTIYGVDNTLLYFPNEVITTSVDGWTTFLAAAVSFVVYVAVAATDTRPDPRKATATPSVDEPEPDRDVEVPARA
ncbi:MULTISPECIES: sodium:solute symporter [unclassified Dietzia]|uniref:sodium:solute symporter family transporter n=1 Tax=unclassified Dietzia TaxID=2617939 RepID=UPI000D21DE74|nr:MULTISPECIES: sodium:solute symporter [unclassified Dietzia]AVZ38271.1 sodium:solute symporter [Dietzia sp. JS16-p6b]QGW23269.1 Na /solute symporter [Dietzia sp. DQ12-45-1b]